MINTNPHHRYVWLIPEFTENPDDALSGVDVIITDDPAPGRTDDLAVGAGGQYRYLDRQYNHAVPDKMVAAALYRIPETADGKSLPDGWQARSGDLNRKRGGDFLYIVWKSHHVGC